jgi:uncharacterized protein (TIGR00730 family)
MAGIRSAAVFCGASFGHKPQWREASLALGAGLAARDIRLVYGGGSLGLMGAVAQGTRSAGGAISGVIPGFLIRREAPAEDIAKFEITDTMHARKQRMFELADCFISMPGGLGTLDETFEILTWKQLSLHDKPILICDVAGSAAPLLATIDATIAMGFARPEIRDLFEHVEGVEALLARLDTLRRGHDDLGPV